MNNIDYILALLTLFFLLLTNSDAFRWLCFVHRVVVSVLIGWDLHLGMKNILRMKCKHKLFSRLNPYH
jgi:hypothetical protein